MSSLPPNKEVDVDFLVFVERYATDLLKWDILTLFGHNPDYRAATSTVAQQIGRSELVVWPELGDLTLLGILQQTQSETGSMLYQLTNDPHLRRLTIKFADSQDVDHEL